MVKQNFIGSRYNRWKSGNTWCHFLVLKFHIAKSLFEEKKYSVSFHPFRFCFSEYARKKRKKKERKVERMEMAKENWATRRRHGERKKKEKQKNWIKDEDNYRFQRVNWYPIWKRGEKERKTGFRCSKREQQKQHRTYRRRTPSISKWRSVIIQTLWVTQTLVSWGTKTSGREAASTAVTYLTVWAAAAAEAGTAVGTEFKADDKANKAATEPRQVFAETRRDIFPISVFLLVFRFFSSVFLPYALKRRRSHENQ